MSRHYPFYDELAGWWLLISPPGEYAEEAASYADLLQTYSRVRPTSLLELGSGGGCNAYHLKHNFQELTLVDAAPAMLEVSRALNPECEHIDGDMFTLRLAREFDCCFVHDAICYATTREELHAVVATAWHHVRWGGVALFVPDMVRETFRESTEHGGSDQGDRGIRYLEWTRDPDPADSTYLVDYAFLIRDGTIEPRVVHDRHVEGLFARKEWLSTLHEVGFDPHVVEIPLEETASPLIGFIGVKGQGRSDAS